VHNFWSDLELCMCQLLATLTRLRLDHLQDSATGKSDSVTRKNV